VSAPVHLCHVRTCHVAVAPEMLMCANHWAMVPLDLRRAVTRYYRPGQCDDKRVSPEWLYAARAALDHVHAKLSGAKVIPHG
jgi:hypothetical protein